VIQDHLNFLDGITRAESSRSDLWALSSSTVHLDLDAGTLAGQDDRHVICSAAGIGIAGFMFSSVPEGACHKFNDGTWIVWRKQTCGDA
jgi:hypothetical protein